MSKVCSSKIDGGVGMRSLVRDAMPDYVRQVYDEVERQQRISNELESGEVLNLKEIRKMMSDKAVMIGRVGDVLCVKKKKKVGDDVIDDLNFQSAILEREVRKAIEKAKKLKTERVEVVKTMPKKPDANDVIRQILRGGVRGYEALKKVMECGL
jgi:chaperonin cofactor prefoldin